MLNSLPGKLLTPRGFSSLAELEQQRLLAVQHHYERTASRRRTFTRRGLHTLLAKLADQRLAPAA
jgi:hypothetical protein